MHAARRLVLLGLVGWGGVSAPVRGDAEVPPHRVKQIRDAAPEQPRVQPRTPRTVLIWNTPPALMGRDPHAGWCIPYGAEAMKALGEKTGAYTPVVSDDIRMILPENIKRFDAIVMNNSSGPWIRPAEEDMERIELRKHGDDRSAVEAVLRRSLLDYVSGGGGIVAYHFAIGANGHWPEFRELLGAGYAGHPWNEEVGVRVEEPDHPLVAAFGGKGFRLVEEIFQFGAPYSRDRVRVLLSLDTATTRMTVPYIERTDGDFALAWVRAHGKGRVFYTALGHRTEIYWNPALLQFYLDAIQCACGDIDAPMAPRPAAESAAAGPPEGFVSLFDGATLAGWRGDSELWSVRDGAITGATTAEHRLTENKFLVWKDAVEDFELRLKFRLRGGNSGIYFRAKERAEGEDLRDPVVGMQADFDHSGRWTGVLMEYLLRNVLAERGQRVVIGEDGARRVVGSTGDPDALLAAVKVNAWNDYTVVARGGHIVLSINGVTMCAVDDRDPRRLRRGVLALQVHTGPPMVVQFKDIHFRGL